MLILGIDPGSRSMGFGLVESQKNDALTLITSGIWSPPSKQDFHNRLSFLSQKCDLFLKKYQPHILVLEKSFYGKNAQTAIKMGEIRGIILTLIGSHKILVKEYAPTTIKMAITGYGRSTKIEIQHMLRYIFPSKKDFQTNDESDAIALAITYHYRQKNPYSQLCTNT